jgi:hypothetical protein
MDSPEAIQSVNGTCTIRRWTGLEVMHYSMFEVPAIVRAYNLFMNAVDRIDQIRSSCPTRRREKRVSMTLFTFVLDLAIINACAFCFKKKHKMRFGCIQCKKAFHPQCFTAFHFRNALTHNKCMLIDLAIKGVENAKGINKKCKHVSNLRDMELD